MSEHYSGGGDKTVAKLVILRQYIWAYEKIMKSKLEFKDRWYIDTHAGTGKTYLEKSDIHVDGSVLRALQFDFDKYLLYEKNTENFETLATTVEEKTDIELNKDETQTGEERYWGEVDSTTIYIYNMDCNKGVELLVDNARTDPHFFVFIDPEGTSFEGRLLDTLIDRGNVDILYNFQSTGIGRNVSEAAEHSHNSVSRMLGTDDWPRDGDVDDYVEIFKENRFENNGFDSVSKKMVSTGENQWRYDLVFGSGADVANKVMDDIMSRKPEQKVIEEIRKSREHSDVQQEGLEKFGVNFVDHNKDIDHSQHSLDKWS